MTSVSPAFVECSPAVADLHAAREVAAGAVSSPDFLCARSDVPIRAIAGIIAEPWFLPVVDGNDRFVGFVSPANTTPGMRPLAELPPRLTLALPLAHRLFGRELAVPEGSSLRWAVHSMAVHRSRVVALVDDAGALRGLLTDLAALHAIAHTEEAF